ncbi:p53-like protein [Lissonota sp. PSUC_FEM 10030012]|nr:p53-like protein [Lissonota sp. PSUC_FEM 10030012]
MREAQSSKALVKAETAENQGNSIDKPNAETSDGETVVDHYNVNCGDGVKLIRITEYPSHRRDSASAVISEIFIEEEQGKSFRAAAIVISDRTIKIKDNIISWDVLRKFPKYFDAMSERINAATPTNVHAFEAKLRYAGDFVLASIGPPKQMAKDEQPIYKITVRRNKHYSEHKKSGFLSKLFDRTKWESNNDGETSTHDEKTVTSKKPNADNLEISSEHKRTKRTVGEKIENFLPTRRPRSVEKYVPLGGIDDHTPVQDPSHLEKLNSGPLEQSYKDVLVSNKRKLAEESEDSRQPKKLAKEEGSSTSTFLAIGSICALSLGVSHLIMKHRFSDNKN